MNALVYTDGSGTAAGGPAGIAYVADLWDGRVEGSMMLRSATNQQAELLAAAYGLDQIAPCEFVSLVSDSEYVVKGMNEWLDGWIARGWKTSSNKTVKNQGHWRRVLAARDRHEKVEFRWVRGHDGDLMNERADELAGIARAQSILRQVEDAVRAGILR